MEAGRLAGWVAVLAGAGWISGIAAHRVVGCYCAGRGWRAHSWQTGGWRAGDWHTRALCASGFALAGTRASGLWLAAAVLLVWWCVCLGLIDARTLRLPNMLTGLGAAGVAGVGLAAGRWQAAAIGGALLAGLYLGARALAGLLVQGGEVQGGFGLGDAKLSIGLGGATALGGGRVWLAAAVAALVLTAAFGLWLARRESRPVRALPHGPAMCMASLISLWALG